MAIGNPALWWASVPVTLWALFTRLARAATGAALFTGAGFLLPLPALGHLPAHAQLQPLPLRGDPLRLPLRWACCSTAQWDDPRQRWIARGYVALAVALFFFFYPFLAALPVPESWSTTTPRRRRAPWTWFPTWV